MPRASSAGLADQVTARLRDAVTAAEAGLWGDVAVILATGVGPHLDGLTADQKQRKEPA